ncbi:MAG TPA: GAF and ANTAR domain-containing protein [Humibacter sp.]|jgi:GAF domain-containing protein|nr:GAF and ANTAR domain-containing protein [Humibacter sp.]
MTFMGADMANESRESKLNAAFVAVADTLTADYDVVDLLHTLVSECTEILDAQAGGLMLAQPGEALQLVASTSERVELVEVMQLSAGAGPCLDCYRIGESIDVPDIAVTTSTWPEFAAIALQHGFHSVHATPLRLRGDVIGTMNLFRTFAGAFPSADADVAQALADVATIGILHERISSQTGLVVSQLQHALDSRILIEQAKGVLAQSASLGMDDAFGMLRRYARSHAITLRAVASGVVDRTIGIEALVA